MSVRNVTSRRGTLLVTATAAALFVLAGCPAPVTPANAPAGPAAPSGLSAGTVSASQIDLAWTDNSSDESGFKIERSSNGNSWAQIDLTGPNVTSYSNSGLHAGAPYYYRVRATCAAGDSAYSNTTNAKTRAPSQTFKVANSWGIGFSSESVPDGYYYITYSAFKSAGGGIFSTFFDDLSAYNPTFLATFQISHPVRGDCYVRIGLGSHGSPVQYKVFNSAGYSAHDPNAFPSNVITVDISEFAANLNSYDLFLGVFDGTTAQGGTTSTGTILSFTVEKYTTYGGAHTTLSSYTTLPEATADGAWTFADIHTAGVIGTAVQPTAAFSKVDSLVNSHLMTNAELASLKARIGVAIPNRNYNVVIKGHGTGLRPPTEAEWAQIQKGTKIIDSLKVALVGAPPAVDLSVSEHFPPIGNQGNQGSCAAWSTGYYIKTFQEALEHNWDLSTVHVIGSYPLYYPDSQLDHIFSPAWIYSQINGGADGGSALTTAAGLLCSLGAATWQTVPYSLHNPSVTADWATWPSEAGYRDAPPHRGAIPSDSEWGMHYFLTVTTDAQIDILKALLAANMPVSIGVDANQYPSLSSDDVWDVGNYVPQSVNHANTVVGYTD
jgi:hypothetical protein